MRKGYLDSYKEWLCLVISLAYWLLNSLHNHSPLIIFPCLPLAQSIFFKKDIFCSDALWVLKLNQQHVFIVKVLPAFFFSCSALGPNPCFFKKDRCCPETLCVLMLCMSENLHNRTKKCVWAATRCVWATPKTSYLGKWVVREKRVLLAIKTCRWLNLKPTWDWGRFFNLFVKNDNY